MKKTTACVLSLVLILGFSITNAETASVKVNKNCTELNKTYKDGVARISSVKNKGGKKYKPFVANSLYDANKSKDRNKDLIACER